MEWKEFLAKNRERIVRAWFEDILATYPEETSRFVRSEKNPFLNPVGSTIKEGIEGIIDWMLGSSDKEEEVFTFLDRIIRIRAIQEFKPSEAIGFVWSFKSVVRSESKASNDVISEDSLRNLDTAVDSLMLKAFDIYMACREQLYELRVQEVKNRTFRLLQRAGLVYEIPASETSSEAGDPVGETT